MRIVVETGRNFSTFLAARLLFVTALLGVAAIFSPNPGSPGPYLVLFGANAVLSLGCWEWYRRHRGSLWLRWFALSAAVVLDTLALHYSGGADSEFIFLYFFSVGSAGLLIGLGAAIWMTLLSIAGMLWLYHESGTGYLAEHALHAFIYSVNFLLTALLTSYVFEKLLERERTHQRTLGELEQTRLDTQAILDCLNTGTVVLNVGQRVLYSNPAGRTILGLSGEHASENVQACVDPDSTLGEAILKTIAEPLIEGRNEIELRTPNGVKPVGFSVSPFYDTGGDLRGHVILFSDLTHVKEVERAERERDRLAAIGGLSRDLAHEIRNPLATVRGCVEMIKLNRNDEEDAPYLELALKESDRLNSLLRDFLNFAHLSTPRRRQNDLRDFIRGYVKTNHRGPAVADTLAAPIPAEFDPDQMGLVLDALMLTLTEWAEENGEIRIEPSPAAASTVRFTLPNKTITAEMRDTAFQPFAGNLHTHSGLALPTALRAVHAHGGKLSLETEPGVGTWFELAI